MVFGLLVVGLCATAMPVPPGRSDEQTGRDALDMVRTELGVSNVRSFELTGVVQKLGMTVTPQGPTEVLRPFALVVRWDASGRYVRTDTFDTPDGAISVRAGFDGPKLLNEMRGSSPANVKLAARFSPEQIFTERRNARRLVLALLVNTGGATVEHASAENTFVCRFGESSLDRFELFLDTTARRPRLIRYTVIARRSPSERDSERARELQVESYRSFQGAVVPTVLNTYETGRLIEIMEIKNIKLNPSFGPAAFSS